MKNLKLTALEADQLSKKAMKSINGGFTACWCGCASSKSGGSNTQNNGYANRDGGGLSSNTDHDKLYMRFDHTANATDSI